MMWIGIHGASESGKDTAADFIVREFGGRKMALADPMKVFCERVFSFSKNTLWGPSEARNAIDPRFEGAGRPAMQHITRVRFGEHADAWLADILSHFTEEARARARTALDAWLEDVLAQEHITCRYILQTLGTEWGRAQDPNLWLIVADRDAKRQGFEGICIIPDCRFLNEGVFLDERQAPLYEVVRPGFEGEQAMQAGVALHQSEMERINQREAFRKYITRTIMNDDTLEVFYDRLRAVLTEDLQHVENGVRGTGPLVRVR